MQIRKHIYGCIPDLKDQRDFPYKVPRGVVIPPKTDLRPQDTLIYDQGELGSCTGNAIAAVHQFEQVNQKKPSPFIPSRLFIYYNERVIEHTVNEDSGAMIRDGIKSIAQQGVCPETEWPYDISKFKNKPSPQCFKDAMDNQALTYYRVNQTLADMKGCLASSYPFVFGFSVYSSFESATVAKTGVVPMPKKNEQMLGGHAVVAVGYDDSTKRFIVRNSWGLSWGMKGYFTMPYDYLISAKLASDFWTVRLVE